MSTEAAADASSPRRTSPPELCADQIALASFPRSGNSLLRSLIEKFTGFPTGSDYMKTTLLSRDLREMGFEGEGDIQGVWVVKTHFPDRRSPSAEKEFPVRKVILLCRNPFDVLDSYFNMVMTGEHTKNIDDEIYTIMEAEFEQIVTSEIKVWNRFHEYWLDAAREGKVAVHVVKYEDLLLSPFETLSGLEEFMSRGTATPEQRQYFAEQINAMTDEGKALATDGAGVYKPRSKPKIFKSVHRYQDGLRRKVLYEARNALVRLGYDELLNSCELQSVWEEARSRADAQCEELQEDSGKEYPGLTVNATESIRDATGSKHGRGFNWKFDFFESHEFASDEAALKWARKYLKRQIGQKQYLGRDMTHFVKCLAAHNVTIEQVLDPAPTAAAADGAGKPSEAANPVAQAKEEGETPVTQENEGGDNPVARASADNTAAVSAE